MKKGVCAVVSDSDELCRLWLVIEWGDTACRRTQTMDLDRNMRTQPILCCCYVQCQSSFMVCWIRGYRWWTLSRKTQEAVEESAIRWESGTCLRALSLSFTLSEGMLCCSVDTSRRRRQVRMMMNCVFQEGTVRAGGGGGVTIWTKSQPDDKIMSICTCTNKYTTE